MRPDQAAQESELASYTQTLGCFFDTPPAKHEELPQDYNLSFFLLYQTFESKGEGSTIHKMIITFGNSRK